MTFFAIWQCKWLSIWNHIFLTRCSSPLLCCNSGHIASYAPAVALCIELAQQARNTRFHMANYLLSIIFRNFISYSSKDGGVCIDGHRSIYEAIMAGHPEKARQASQLLFLEERYDLRKPQ